MREVGVIDNGAVLIVDGIIQDVGPSNRVENLAAARDAVEVSADGRVVMPGFVDCRTQLVCGPPLLPIYEGRIAGDNPPAIESTGALMKAVKASTRPRLEMLARKSLREFVRHGTTTLDAHSGLGPDTKTELKILRALHAAGDHSLDVLPTFYGAAGLPPGSDESGGEYLRRTAAQVLPRIRRLKLASFVDVRCGSDGFDVEAAGEYLTEADRLGFVPRVTSSETGRDGGVALALAAGASSVDHLDWANEDDGRQLAGTRTVATLLPGVSFHLMRDRNAPARQLIDAGAAVALASGFSSDRCPTCSMPAILSLACNQLKMTPAEAVTAATINGAHALLCGNQIGSIEYGKQADLIMLNLSDYREIPYHFGMNLVAMMMKRGDVIYPRMDFPWS